MLHETSSERMAQHGRSQKKTTKLFQLAMLNHAPLNCHGMRHVMTIAVHVISIL